MKMLSTLSSMKSSDDPLKETLASWQVEPEFRPEFNREVWRKIAASNSAHQAGFWQKRVSALFIAPRLVPVSALAIAMLTLSLGTANLAAKNANSRHWSMLEDRYAQSINPLTRSSMKE